MNQYLGATKGGHARGQLVLTKLAQSKSSSIQSLLFYEQKILSLFYEQTILSLLFYKQKILSLFYEQTILKLL